MTETSKKILAETPLYEISTESVKSTITISGTDDVYSVINKETKVVEGRAATLPDALAYMHNLQLNYDNITKQASQASLQ